jgi:hypothetical protein
MRALISDLVPLADALQFLQNAAHLILVQMVRVASCCQAASPRDRLRLFAGAPRDVSDASRSLLRVVKLKI